MKAEKTYPEALRTLNNAVWDTLFACRDTTEWPDVDRHFLRELAAKTDRMVDDIAEPIQ